MLYSMKKFFTLLYVAMFAMAFCCSPYAQADESVGKQFLRDLVRKGVQVVQDKLDEQDRNAVAQSNGAAPAGESSASISVGLTHMFREVVKETMEGVKAQYKEEGRVYARQLGDVLAERIIQNSKVQSALLMLKIFAWVVAVYLTLVTLLLLWSLRRLSLSNKRILHLLEEREPRPHVQQ